MITRVFARSLTVSGVARTLALSGCSDGSMAGAQEKKNNPPATAPREVQVTPAAERTVARTVSGTGTLAADEQVVLGTKVAGRLAEITVDLGTRVKRGQMIGKLDQSDFKLRVDQAEAALQQARVRLGLPPTGPDERIDPEKTAIVRQARAMLDDARLIRDRSVKLMEMELIARAQLDSVEAGLQVAEGRYQDALEEGRKRQAIIAQRPPAVERARQQPADTVLAAPLADRAGAEPYANGGGGGTERARVPAAGLLRAGRHHDRGQPARGDRAHQRGHRVRRRREGAGGSRGQDGRGPRDDRAAARRGRRDRRWPQARGARGDPPWQSHRRPARQG